MTITGQAIRENPNYTGGLIGFALIRGGGSYYFTERQYNPLCNGGPCDDGGNDEGHRLQRKHHRIPG